MTSKTTSRSGSRRAIPGFLLCLFLLSCGGLPLLSNDQVDARRIVEKLGVAKGAVLGEIGAGTGGVALEIAELLGKEGKLYANELDETKLKTLRSRASESKGAPIEVPAPERCRRSWHPPSSSLRAP
jgi:hypothetical protein